MAEDSALPVDLTTCDLEPIHVIGRIQSFGYLLSFSGDWIINHVSCNCGDLFGVDPLTLLGTPIGGVLTESALHDVRTRMQMLGGGDAVERLFDVDLRQDGKLHDLAVHRSGRSYVLEIEPSESGKRRDYVSYVRPMIDRMRQLRSVDKLCESAARQLRALTGFDRVMIYRFERDGAGEVVAESLNGRVDSYLGQHFPASDIPAQARRLYVRNTLRIISDIDDPTVPIAPAVNPDGEPLDLSMSGLRAVSPIHIEYLRNMGVRASMSVSIMRRGQLWGLMACHHYSPLHLFYSVRTAAELFGEYFAFILEQAESDRVLAKRQEAVRLHDEIMTHVAAGRSLLSGFGDFAASIGSVIPYDGIACWIDGEFRSEGLTPDRAQVEELARFLNTAGAGRVWASDNLISVYPQGAWFLDKAAGLLALPVSRSPRDYIVLFRREHRHDIQWAGDPRKPVAIGPHGARLTPRQSFEIWHEERQGFAKPWEADEIASAESLRVTLLEVVLRLTDAVSQEREQASLRQDTLIAELNHRVRNILNLIRGLVAQSKESSDTIDEFAAIVSNRIQALARAHDQVTRTSWSPASLHQLIRTESDAYLNERIDRMLIDGPDAMVTPGAFTTIALVFHELVTNSCKYGALSNSAGSVHIATRATDDGALAIEWRETGGPPVKAPTRRGFGSAIIERTFPHELGGEAEIDFHPDGLVGRFLLPAPHIAEAAPPPSTLRPDAAAPAIGPDTGPGTFAGTALIVEDNVIIAMEAEDVLGELGFDSCEIVGSVSAAMTMIDERDISFAMLDVNLGTETSEAVAVALSARGTPFIFASGYGDSLVLPEAMAKVPVVAKPYSGRDIKAAIARLYPA
ncbi:MAG TPA: HWE histidine kinase domain-containing protein [Novosphingobium sp.]|nr:HWE histidine kinase domain-containing protein [Novosphingobium sp.]